ncbi:hypothetical protein BGP75_13910 [Motiliproteus sp. MSK22-1]|nr:hypothetical protein BGP75_13910 [Motiliproteus sp. MSK22-1]
MPEPSEPERASLDPVEEILADWDCMDLMEGVGKLAAQYPSHSLKDWLLLTHLAENYQQHHKVKDLH